MKSYSPLSVDVPTVPVARKAAPTPRDPTLQARTSPVMPDVEKA